MELPYAFGIGVAENGFFVTQYDPYENPITTRFCASQDKVFEFIRSRMDDYLEDLDELQDYYEVRGRDAVSGGDFDDKEGLPECLQSAQIHENIKDSDNAFAYARKQGILDKPKPRKHTSTSKPWWKFWQKD